MLMLISDANSFAPEQQVGHFDCSTSGKPHPSGKPFLWPPSLTSHKTHIWTFDGQPHASGMRVGPFCRQATLRALQELGKPLSRNLLSAPSATICVTLSPSIITLSCTNQIR
jgi:hypothetical protein